jgi:hypothetical protein
MDQEFVKQVRSYVPEDALFLHVGRNLGGMIELKDGTLMSLSAAGRSISPDGGVTWTEPEPICGEEGRPLEEGLVSLFPPRTGWQFTGIRLLRLKSGGIGGFAGESNQAKPYGNSPWFTRSDDEGKTWSKPVRMAEPYNNAVMHGAAALTSTGRIVAPVYDFIGQHLRRERGRAPFRDQFAFVGHHGHENAMCYCWAYYSDDEGQTWRPNDEKGIWATGAELFVTLDTSAGGHFTCEEPDVVEVSPEHLLMIHRTSLGRLFQSWSSDNGGTWSQPEPTTLASSRSPAAIARIPGTGDLLIIWNQSSADEIENGLQRHRLSSAVSKDGGETWQRGRNVFSVFQQRGDISYVEPPPIQNYRAMDLAPRLPSNDIEGMYPYLTLWKDRAIIQFGGVERARSIVDSEGKTSYERRDLPASERQRLEGQKHPSTSGEVCIGLPISWFFEG